MEENAKKNKRGPVTGKELAWYTTAGIFAVAGLTFLVFGIIGAHFPGKASDNWVIISENAWLTNWSKMGYRWWGLILIGIAALIGCISLTIFAKVSDRDQERVIRRQQRLVLEQQGSEKGTEPIEVKAEDKKPVEEKTPKA